jgi:hypothetical protein
MNIKTALISVGVSVAGLALWEMFLKPYLAKM